MKQSDWTDVGPITTTDGETEAAALAMSAFVARFTGRARMAAAAAAAVVYNRTVRPATYVATKPISNVMAILADPSISADDSRAILAYIA